MNATLSQFPWSALFAIAGTVVGVLIGFFGSLRMSRDANAAAMERLRLEQRQADRTRFHDLRVELYGMLLAASQSCRESAVALYHHIEEVQGDVEDAALKGIRDAISNLSAVSKRVELVACAGTRVATDELVGAAAFLSVPAWADEKEFNSFNQKLGEAEKAFSEAARAELLSG